MLAFNASAFTRALQIEKMIVEYFQRSSQVGFFLSLGQQIFFLCKRSTLVMKTHEVNRKF